MKCGELLPTIFFSDPCRSRLCPVRVLSGADEDPVQTGSGPAASLRRSCGCRPPLAAEEGRVSVPVKPEPPRTPVPVAGACVVASALPQPRLCCIAELSRPSWRRRLQGHGALSGDQTVSPGAASPRARDSCAARCTQGVVSSFFVAETTCA